METLGEKERMKNLFSYLFYRYFFPRGEKSIFEELLDDIERDTGATSDALVKFIKNKKKDFIRNTLSKIKQDARPMAIQDPEKFHEHVVAYAQQDSRVLRAYYMDVETIFPGLMMAIGNYVFPFFENGIYFDIFSNEPAIPESSLKGALSRVITQWYCMSVDPECFELYQKLVKKAKEKRKKTPGLREALVHRLTRDGARRISSQERLVIPRITLITRYLGSSKEQGVVDLEVFTPHYLAKDKKKKIRDQLKKKYGIDLGNSEELSEAVRLEVVNPVPIYLFKVPEGQRFRIYLILRRELVQLPENLDERKRTLSKFDNISLVLLLLEALGSEGKIGRINFLDKGFWMELLRYTLELEGLGAHTAYGYGRFRIISELQEIPKGEKA